MTNPFSIRRVFWADQETVTVWPPTAENQAGSMEFGTDGILVCGTATNGPSLIWTTLDVWRVVYIGEPFVFSFQKAGDNCGIISPHAFVAVDAMAFWMGQSSFYLYDGFVQPIPCEVQDYVFKNINRAITYSTVWALANPAFGEITWFYPSASATVCDSYVTYNFREKHWTFGLLDRQCGVSSTALSNTPIMMDSLGNIYDHETGTDYNSEGTPELESGPIEVANGEQVVSVRGMLPDDNTVGDVNLTIYGKFHPDDASEISNGPLTLTAWSTFRFKARQVRLKFTQVNSVAWRLGNVRLSGHLSSKR